MIKLYINEKKKMGHINPEIYGHFSEHLGRCIYEGVYVGENSDIPNVNGMRTDVVEALKEIKVSVLRWPGGCFADEYHWMDGIGPKEKRKKMINTHWGGVVEDNSFGTHEFFELCKQIGCKTYITGNLGSGSVREMSEWVEYMTFEGMSPLANLRKENGHEEPFKIDYFGVGNENWGCGGNMTPQYYANEYRRYQTYIRTYNEDKPIYKVACGPSVDDYYWTEELLKTAGDNARPDQHCFMDGLSLHHYTFPFGWDPKDDAVDFTEEGWYKAFFQALYMEELIVRHGAIMDKYDPDKKIGLIVDEWGDWFKVEEGTNPGFLYQQNTVRDALVAGLTLNVFNKHCDRVKMANLAQMVNVLQSVVLTEGEKMIKTPTFYVFKLYKYHQDAELIDSFMDGVEEIGIEDAMVPALQESVSVSEDGMVNITLNNLSHDTDNEVEISFMELNPSKITASIVTGKMNAHNTFEEPDNVKDEEYTSYRVENGKIIANIPARSVVLIRVAQM